MSTTNATHEDFRAGLIDSLIDFYRTYYDEEVAAFAQAYPKDRDTLFVEHRDLFTHDRQFARSVIEQPDRCHAALAEALHHYDLPADVDLSGASVVVTDTQNSIPRKRVGEVNKNDLGRYVALRCQLGNVSERKPRLKSGAFKCMQCRAVTDVPQQFTDTREPHQCGTCERQGPFNLVEQDSDWTDQRKVKLQTPPEEESAAELVGYCLDSVADPNGVDLHKKAGARVTVLGKLEADGRSLFGHGQREPVPDQYFVPKAFVWGDNLTDEIDVDDHRSEVREYAGRPDAIDLFARNIDPTLVITDEWELATEMATVWLFAAPRIDPPEGNTVRGDVHMLFVSDPGMNKSDFASNLADLSPKAVLKDAEGMSSSVALTAAATQEGFGDESWSIEPGALPKANNGHLILDEIDKGPDGFLNGIHSPLEGDQTLRVEKAGQEATLATRCGFLALGNPTDGRFDPMVDIAEQVDLHPALMSRFDLICTMEDTPERDTDDEIASGVLDSIDESARLDHGELDQSEASAVSGEVPRPVMKAWVKLARQEVQPLLSPGAKEVLQKFYVDARDANGDGSDAVPATARKLVAGIRIAMAYARCELSDTVEARHAERAVQLSRTMMGQHEFDPETGDFDSDKTSEQSSGQQQRVRDIVSAIQSEAKSPEQIAEETEIAERTVRHRLKKLSQAGEVLEPQQGEYRAT